MINVIFSKKIFVCLLPVLFLIYPLLIGCQIDSNNSPTPTPTPVPTQTATTTATATPTSGVHSWEILSLNDIPSNVTGGVIWINMLQATATDPLVLVIGASSATGQSVYAFKEDDGSWTDISEAAPPRLYSNSGSLVSSITPVGEPIYWYQGPDLTIGQSQVRTCTGNPSAWVIKGSSPAPSTSVGEYRYLYFTTTGTPRILYQKAQWSTDHYVQNLYLREFTSDWGVPAGVPDPIAAPGNQAQIPKIRAADGPNGELHIVIFYTPDNTTATLQYYRWDGTLTGPENIAATNLDGVIAIAVNPVDSQPYVITEDVGTSTTRTLSAYRHTATGWQLVGASASLSRTIYNNSSVDLAFTADGTLWAGTQTSSTALSIFRYSSAWEEYTWTAANTINYKGMALVKDGRVCLFARPTSSGSPVNVVYLDTW